MKSQEIDLEEADGEEPIDFPPPERKIVTQPYDLSLSTLRDQWSQKLLVIPEIQREYVWDNGRASRLIESLLLNIPVPPIYFAEREDSVLEIVDGHQRVKSIVRFISNEFALSGLGILSEYMGARFHKLPPNEQRHLLTRTLRAVVLGRESHPNMKFEVFERLNTGGIALNAQELRNSLYRGSLNRTLHKLAAQCKTFRALIGTKTPRRRMVDEELILRWFAMRDNLRNYKPPLKRFLNEYMDANKRRSEAWLEEREEHFDSTMNLTYDVLGSKAFRLMDENGNPLVDKDGKKLPSGVNRALFDAQSSAFSWVKQPVTESHPRALAEISKVLQDPEFQDAVRRATSDRARIRLRVSRMVKVLRSCGFEVTVPEGVELSDALQGT